MAGTQTSGPLGGVLSVVGTPIGNLRDVTPRALETLRAADLLLCEDTRVTSKLLAHFGIRVPLQRADENVLAERVAPTIARIEAGGRVAFVSDAGMPGVSDPGQRLVDAALDRGLRVEVIPGPSAVTCALVASGLPMEHFFFEGFLPRKASAMASRLEALAGIPGALVVYESPHRVTATLDRIAEEFPARQVALVRELTKLHEEVFKGPAQDVLREFSEREAHGAIRGEIALVVGPPTPDEADRDQEELRHAAVDRARELLSDPSVSKKDIVRMLKSEFGMGRNEAYELVHAL